jgi:hypothetical protein
MGYNPLRRYRGGKATDVALMIGTLMVIALLVVWASR